MWGGGGGSGGQGGGGGGYGGGVLYIVASQIVYDPANPPKFVVSGQVGGSGYEAGKPGQGGLLVVFTTTALDSSMWQLKANYDAVTNSGGHGTVQGGPAAVFLNPKR
jgi:hypothetical protein